MASIQPIFFKKERLPLEPEEPGAVPFVRSPSAHPLERESLEILIDIVNKCNLRCVMCHFSFDEIFYRHPKLMSPEKFEEILAAIRPFTRRLTLSAAYEPTVSPHFAAMLRIAKKYSFRELSFITNGNIMPESLAEAIVECGVTEVCVSVHAARPETYAKILRGGSLDKAIKNVERLLRVRKQLGDGRTPVIQFNIALMRSNLAELIEIIELAARLGIDAVAFRHLIVFEGLNMESESLARYDKRAVNHCVRKALERAHELGVVIRNAPDYFAVEGANAHAQCVEWKPGGEGSPPAVSIAENVRRKFLGFVRGIGPPEKALYRQWPGRPFGNIDAPADDAEFSGDAAEMTGWALSPLGIDKLQIARESVPGDSASSIGRNGLVVIGDAQFHNSTRPDVMRAQPHIPFVYRAGWSFVLKRSSVPATANGKIILHAIAVDRNGMRASIGRRIVSFRDGVGGAASLIRCHKPFNSLYVDAHGLAYPYPDCHTDQPFGEFAGQPFEDVWHDARLEQLRDDMTAGHAPEMCRRCPLFINREVDTDCTFEPHGDFSREDRR